MNQRMNIGQIYPNRPGTMPMTSTAKAPTRASDLSFGHMLDQQMGITSNSGALKFSNHAMQRLTMRGIELNTGDIKKLESAVEKAAAKGSKESLVWMNNVAYVVSVKNHTVVTAVDRTSMKDHVFTQIDSAIFI